MTTIGREYLRVSQDRTGRMESPQQQHEDNERDALANGWVLGEPYAEPEGVSASRFSAKARDEFDRLTSDLESGRFGAQILILWECSRGSRKLSEWARLIEQCDEAGIKIYVTSHARIYDPKNWRDRRTLQEDGVDSETESGKASARIRRAAAATARDGKPHGRIPYGYAREYAINERGKRVLVRQFPVPAEAAVVKEIFDRLADGNSLKSIARDLTARGIRTRTGKVFDAQHVRDLALRPIYGGLRVHSPGERRNRYTGPLEGAVTATWPALVEPEIFYKVRQLLQDPARRTSRPGRGKHLLSMIAVCDCGGPMTVTYRYGEQREYVCRDGSHRRILADALDAYAQQVILAYLARDDVIGQLRAQPEGGELAKVREELAQARSELGDWRAAAAAGKVSPGSWQAIEPGLLTRITRLEVRERELSTPSALSVIPPGADVALRWAAAPMPARRMVARLLCSPAVLGTLTVGAAPTQGHRGDPAARVSWDRDH